MQGLKTLPGIVPDFSAIGGGTASRTVGALLTLVLVAAAGTLIVSAASWALGEANGNYQAASRGKTGVLISLGAAALAGGAIAIINWLINIGGTM